MAKQKIVSKLSRCARALNAALAHYFAQKCGADEAKLLDLQQSKKTDEGMAQAYIYLCEDDYTALNFSYMRPDNDEAPVTETQCALNHDELYHNFMYVRLSPHAGIGVAYSGGLPAWPAFPDETSVLKALYQELNAMPLDTMQLLNDTVTGPMFELIKRHSNLLDEDFFSEHALYMEHPGSRRKKEGRPSSYGMLSWRRLDTIPAEEIESDAKIFMNFGNALSSCLHNIFYYNDLSLYDMLESGKIESLKGLCAKVAPIDISMLNRDDPDPAVLLDDETPLPLGIYPRCPVEDLSTSCQESYLPLSRGYNEPPRYVLLSFLQDQSSRGRISAIPKEIVQGSALQPEKVVDFKHAITLSADGFAIGRSFGKKFKLVEYYRTDKKTKLKVPREAEIELRQQMGEAEYLLQAGTLKKGSLVPLMEQQLLAILSIGWRKGEFTPADEDSACCFDLLTDSFEVMLRLLHLRKVRHEYFKDSRGRKQRMLMPAYYGTDDYANEADLSTIMSRIYSLGLKLRELCARDIVQVKLDKKADELSAFALGDLWLSWLLTQTVQVYLLDAYDPDLSTGDSLFWFFSMRSFNRSNETILRWVPLLWPSANSFWFGKGSGGNRIAGTCVKQDHQTLREHFEHYGFEAAFTDRCLLQRPSAIKAAVPAMFCLSCDDVKQASAPEGLLLDSLNAKPAGTSFIPPRGIKPETIPAGSDLDFVKQLYQPEVMTEQLQGLTLHLPAMERGENEVSLLPCYILFYKDGRRRVMTLKELFDENRSDSLLFALLRGCELYHFLSFAEFLPDELEVQSHGFDFSCELDQFESIIESMNQYCGSVRAGIEPRARFVTIPLYTVASSNIQTMELTDVLYIDLPDIVNLQLPDNYIDLESMLQFNWKLAVGSDTLSEDDFEKLRKNSGKIVKLHDKFVRADEKKLKNYREKIERLDRMNRHLLLLATLTGSYDGSDVVVGKKLEDARASIFAAGDNSLPRNLASDLTLRPYQVLGYSWLLRNARSGIGSILADDMGLGKTVQLIAVLQKLKEEDELNEHPALIVVPSSVLINWKNELKRFAPQLQVYIYHGDKRSHENLTCHDVILSTYGTVRTSYKKLNGLTYSIIAVDEAQKIKNYASQSVKALKALKGRRYAALTGTPVENRLSEYWSIMDFVNPGLLGARTRFNAEIAVPIEKYRDPLALDRFKRMTGPFILRRVKTDKNIISDLPDKIVTDEFCSLTPAQVTLYQAVLDEIMQKIRDTSTVFTIERSALVLQLINSLKQICNSPVQYVSGRNIDHQYTAEDSGKVRHLFSLCGRLMENGHRTLIFTQYTVMGELLQAWMKKELKVDVPFIRGSLSPKQRQDIVDKFQSGDMPFLMLSLKAGGTGINLTKADAVIHFDLWWNPAVEEQATDRAYRIGQHNNVQVYRFITANTFEEKINAIIQSKKELSDLTVVSGSKWLGELSNDELADLFALTREDLS